MYFYDAPPLLSFIQVLVIFRFEFEKKYLSPVSNFVWGYFCLWWLDSSSYSVLSSLPHLHSLFVCLASMQICYMQDPRKNGNCCPIISLQRVWPATQWNKRIETNIKKCLSCHAIHHTELFSCDLFPREFLQRYSLMSNAIREVPPGEVVFNLEKFGQIFNQDTLQLRKCMVNPQGTAQKTLLWWAADISFILITSGL